MLSSIFEKIIVMIDIFLLKALWVRVCVCDFSISLFLNFQDVWNETVTNDFIMPEEI
jgi:hypothetical protein